MQVCHADVAAKYRIDSHDTSRADYTVSGPLAQLVEQRTFNPWVVGSSPTGPTNQLGRLDGSATIRQASKNPEKTATH